MKIVAVDCDLRKLYAVSSHGEQICKAVDGSAAIFAITRANPDLVIFEIASPVDYSEMPGQAYQKRRWMLYNMAMAMKFHTTFAAVLVSPSSKWTHGYDLATRHKIAGCDMTQKDLRECQAMNWFYMKAPERWVTLPKYLEDL